MQLNRTIGHAPRTEALVRDVANLPGPCVGCAGCQGICEALFDAILIPDIILRDRHT
jgi:formate hydrogenlyase subunit 6/NADH:ubiquinone oxidoreductase subunit I